MVNSGHNLTAHRYTNQVLHSLLLPFLQHQPRLFGSKDNARPHTDHVVQQLFSANNVNVLPWPTRSTDLSPIEHLWDHLGQRIRRRPNPRVIRDQLVQALRQEWRAIPGAVIRRLTNSVRRRTHACILAPGGHTHY